MLIPTSEAKINPVALLLCTRSPILKRLVLETLIDEPDVDEIAEVTRAAGADPVVEELVSTQRRNGSWEDPDTPWALFRLGALGFDESHPAVARGAEHLFSLQRADGSWPLPSSRIDDGEARRRYDMIPLQTALPLIGLAACGYALDERCDRAYRWLLEQRLDDGAWPAGTSGGVFGYIAGFRRLPHSRWGCRSNTTGAALALALHPELATTPETRRAVDLLLGRETREQSYLGFETARLYGFEPVRGFFTRFARFDPGLLLELAAATGAGTDDPRIADLIDWILARRTAAGLWSYNSKPDASYWVSYRLLRTLASIGPASWESDEPRTPFAPYLRPIRRW